MKVLSHTGFRGFENCHFINEFELKYLILSSGDVGVSGLFSGRFIDFGNCRMTVGGISLWEPGCFIAEAAVPVVCHSVTQLGRSLMPTVTLSVVRRGAVAFITCFPNGDAEGGTREPAIREFTFLEAHLD